MTHMQRFAVDTHSDGFHIYFKTVSVWVLNGEHTFCRLHRYQSNWESSCLLHFLHKVLVNYARMLDFCCVKAGDSVFNQELVLRKQRKGPM